MKTLGSATEIVAQVLLQGREQDRSSLSLLASEAGGAAGWLSLHGLGDCPDDLTIEELTSETQAFWQDAAVRARSCARCPEQGGACAQELSCFEHGSYLEWTDRMPTVKRCTRWPEHVIRQRLAECGVPFRLQGFQEASFQCVTEQLAQARFETSVLVKLWIEQRAIPCGSPWLLFSGNHGSGKSHLMIAALRTVRRVRPAVRVWYHDKEASEDPFAQLREAKLLALDKVNPSQWKPWFHKEVESVLRDRWDAGLATMLASNDQAELVVHALSSLSRFAQEAVLCKLT